jgi:hypothetical protein
VSEGVDEALLTEWTTSMPGLAQESELAVARNAPKAWRFVGEMREIATSFEDHSLPGGFALAAADIYERLSGFKDSTGTTLHEAVENLLVNEHLFD